MVSPADLYSPQSERSLLGACLLSGAARDVLVAELAPEDFYVPSHQVIADALTEMHRGSLGIDTTTVGVWLDEKGLLAAAGGITGLVGLMVDAPATVNAGTYAATIRERAIRRGLAALLAEAQEWNGDLRADSGDVLDRITRGLVEVRSRVKLDETPSPDVDQFMATARARQHEWIVPSLLERGDRMLVTASEGAGKSVLCRQLALQLTSGVVPFQPRNANYRPARVMVLDLENSEMQVTRGMERMLHIVRPHGQRTLDAPAGFDPDLLRIEANPQGINLLAREDRRWLVGKVRANQPDVIITGSLYKMYVGDENSAETAGQVRDFLDHLRADYGCALIIEAHAPYTQDAQHQRILRPVGSSVWSRWPEFGYGFRAAEGEAGTDGAWDWVAWRPPRDDQRAWPRRLRRGGPHTWPWVNYYGGDGHPEPARRGAVPNEPPPGYEPDGYDDDPAF